MVSGEPGTTIGVGVADLLDAIRGSIRRRRRVISSPGSGARRRCGNAPSAMKPRRNSLPGFIVRGLGIGDPAPDLTAARNTKIVATRAIPSSVRPKRRARSSLMKSADGIASAHKIDASTIGMANSAMVFTKNMLLSQRLSRHSSSTSQGSTTVNNLWLIFSDLYIIVHLTDELMSSLFIAPSGATSQAVLLS